MAHQGLRFAGKAVVVTGASRGIGRGVALRFAREGADVVVAANEPKVEEVAAEIRALGRRSIHVVLDVTDRISVDALYDRTAKEFGRLDVSVQNAGVITIARLEDLSEADWDRVMAVNTKGVFLCCKAAARHMVNAFCPGIIDTDMWAYNDREWGKLLGDYKPGELMQEWVDGIPLKRVGTPDDVAGLVAFLASDDASYITGQTVNVGLFMS